MESWSVIAGSTRQTMSWGRKLGKLAQGGEIIGLVGELGSGKTTFVRGFAAGAEVQKNAWVRSPTFTLINEYQGRVPIYHIDLYRIGKAEEIDALNLREYLYSAGASLIEWFDYLPPGEVDEYLEVRMAHAGRNGRELTLVAHGERYEKILKKLRQDVTHS